MTLKNHFEPIFDFFENLDFFLIFSKNLKKLFDQNIQTLALYQSISCDHCNRHPSDKFDTAIPVDFQMLHLGTVSAHNQLLKTKMDKADA